MWKWCDNDGKVHKFRIPNSYYVPQGNCRLLSPQHWAKTQLGPYATASRLDGIGETTTHNKCVLFWDKRQFSLDIYMGPNDNVATFYLAAGFQKFDHFCQCCEVDYDKSQEEPITAMPAGVVSDDEDTADDDDDVDTGQQDEDNNEPRQGFWSFLSTPLRSKPRQTPSATPEPRTTAFDLDGTDLMDKDGPAIVENEVEEEKEPTSAQEELLRYHIRFGHISFAKLKNMAQQNIIPRHLAKVDPPVCTACMFAKASRRRWRDKRRKHWTNSRKANKRGSVKSIGI